MTAAEQGLLLLCCKLEDDIQPLTYAQFRTLGERVRASRKPEDSDRELCAEDLERIGCSPTEADRILLLLSRQKYLDGWLEDWNRQGITVITLQSENYPWRIRERLKEDTPTALFLLGDPNLLHRPGIALVGSRDLTSEGTAFAAEVGRLAARSGHVLISGNARGADQVAQEACLEAGGSVVAFVADRMLGKEPRERVLYVGEDGPGWGFTSYRALHRNRLIHSAGVATFVAQCTCGKGGTWDGTVRNLQRGWSPVYIRDDGTEAMKQLCALGAKPITVELLKRLPHGQL